MQQLLDHARKNPALAQYAEGTSINTAKRVRTEEENEQEIDTVSKKLADFFGVTNQTHSIHIGEYEFVVKNLESTHFIQGSLKLPDPKGLDEGNNQAYFSAMKDMYNYFIRALVCVKKGKDTVTPEMLVNGMPKYAATYYDELGRSLSQFLTLEQVIQLVTEYTIFFGKVDAKAIEKKTK